MGYTVEVAEHGFRLREIPARIEEIHSIRGREIQTAKELLKEGYTSEQLLSGLSEKSLDEKSQLWASGGISDLLKNTPPGPPPDREEHEIDYQAWFITRRPKEITSAAELRTAVGRSFKELGFDVFIAPQEKPEQVVPMDLSKVIEQGVQAVFERESTVRVDHLVGEIVRLAPGQASNLEIEAALKNRTEFVRKKIGDHEMITTRAIIAEEQAIIDAVKEGIGKKTALVKREEYQTPEELKPTYDRLAQLIADPKRTGEEIRRVLRPTFGNLSNFFVALVPRVRPEHHLAPIQNRTVAPSPMPHASHRPGSGRKSMESSVRKPKKSPTPTRPLSGSSVPCAIPGTRSSACTPNSPASRSHE